ncbi:hypothetical protein Q8A67_025493 [Cirrhinus molitorella]|uniref:Uncharacterized protein n=1 Tax=Cirrhinus molitorella TaxID=172907 RepID=A0AA88NUM3_9TELE|nr:hypothetical protein Q8A67_025493 [Cirrhinus molitorella]
MATAERRELGAMVEPLGRQAEAESWTLKLEEETEALSGLEVGTGVLSGLDLGTGAAGGAEGRGEGRGCLDSRAPLAALFTSEEKLSELIKASLGVSQADG